MVDPIPPRADRIVMYGNVTKRPLSSGGTTTSAPAKRIAIEMNHAPRDPVVFRNTLESSKNDVAFDHFDVQENCPPLPLDPFGPLTSEIRQTPSSVIFPLDANETESELESSWMNEFVDFDQTDLDIPSPGTLSLNTTSAESQTLSVEHDEPFHKLHSTITDHVSSVGDGYGLVDSDEEDLARLIETSCSGLPKLPSTCATQMTPRDSRSPTRFDAKLQHSLSTPGKSAHSQISTAEPDLLDDDVDWDLVTQCVTKVTANDKKSDAADGDSTSSTLAPFTRPPFPAKVRDRSVVAGLSTNVVMRTCFGLGELLDASAKCDRQKQAATWEVFARVNYSNRESATRTQHFQLRDLFSDNQPYLTGTFKDWRNGSCADAQSSVFLGRSRKDKLCRCICRLTENRSAALGLSAIVLAIRETTWDEVQFSLRIMARDAALENGDEEEQTSSATKGMYGYDDVETGDLKQEDCNMNEVAGNQRGRYQKEADGVEVIWRTCN